MSGTELPTSPTASRFGWTKPARIEEFATLLRTEGLPTHRVVFQGQSRDIPIIRVPIGLPKYRLANGRTASLQVEHLAKNPGLRADLFSGDPELWDAQEAQHGLLLKLARQAELARYFEDTSNTQVAPIILDENGFVVNGNRRLSTWRQLLADDKKKYGHYANIDVAVLPHCSEREIDRLEAMLQIEKDIRADYAWDAQANMMIAKMEKEGFTPAELGDLYRMKDSEIQTLLDMREYGAEYLRSRGKEDLWSEISPQEFGFRRLVLWRAKVSGVARQEMFKEAVFALIDDPSAVGRLYEAIPALADSLQQVSDRLSQEFTLETPQTDDELDELFGDGGTTAAAPEIGLIAVLREPATRPRAREVIANVLEAQRQLKKDSKAAGYLLDTCAKANAALVSAVKDGLRAESKRNGVSAQLDGIEANVAKIRQFLAQHAQD
jgi:hypothetical protein